MNFKKTIFIICVFLFLLSGKEINAQTTDTFRYISDTTQTWVVPPCVHIITISCSGAQGGSIIGRNPVVNDTGGMGAKMIGTFAVTYGETLTILVGQAGTSEYHNYSAGGGGGGSFVMNGSTPLIIAGGGGGRRDYLVDSGHLACTQGTSDTVAQNSYLGTLLNGGYGGQGYGDGGHSEDSAGGGDGGPGGGLYVNGHKDGDSTYAGGPGLAYIHKGTPGVGCTSGLDYGGAGGYGGGGGATFCYRGQGGGGGGYTGGGTGRNDGGSGGGGSLNKGTNQTNITGGAAPGNGLVTITYYNGYGLFTAVISGQTNPVCGFCNGSLTVTATGGGVPYTYSWSPGGQTTATATGLCAGTYTVTASDSCGDIITASAVLTAIPLSLTTKVTANDKCNGSCTGSATATIGIGTSPYTYTWAPTGGSKATATGLCAGIYTITVKDANGCTGTASATITQPSALRDSIIAQTNILCNGANTGSVSTTASGGVSPYSYKWSPTNQTTATATGLAAGVYTLAVTDSSGCTGTTSAIITQPTQVTTSLSVNNVPCNGGVGNATVTATGGISPYTYLWSPTAQKTANATGLGAGAYTIKVTDNNGCTTTNTVTITQPAVLTVTTTSTHAYCNLPNGTATANVIGGTSPYTYLWTPSAETTALATGLFVGSYTVTVTDNHQCSTSATVIITQPTLVTAKITSVTPITCNNTGTGTATVAGSGGTTPYTYLWTPSAETTATATGLFAVSYTVTVTDANGCSATATTTLTQPGPVTATISEPKVICKDSTGILIANITGGTPGYKYAWSSGSTSAIATITPTFTNDYSVTVTDANGCSGTANIVLQYGPSFAVAISGKKSVCVGDSTNICANAIGAIDGVTYLWEPENNTNECINVSPALVLVYTVTVVDGCGSTTTANETVYSEPTPIVNMNVNFSQGCVPFCVQFLNGSSIAKGKIAQYVWSFGDGDSTHSQEPVYCYKSSGEYNVSLTVVSDSGCSATLNRIDMVTVYSPPKAEFTYSPNPASIENSRIQFTDKSTDAYGIAYQWWTFGDESDSASNVENPVHTYHDTGTYCATLVVMNNGGCMDTVTNCLVIEPEFKLYIPSAFTPNGDGKDEAFQPIGQYVKSFEMFVFDRWGIELFHSTSINQGWNGTIHGAGPICQEDVYVYKIIVTDSEDNQHSYIGNVTLLK